MKALFLKDMYTLKSSRFLLLMIIGVAVIVMILNGEEGFDFIVSYVSVLSAVLVLNTMNYDEMDNGYAFLLTMPFSRKQYVLEKYLFGLGTGCSGLLLALVLGMIAAVGFGNEMGGPGGDWVLLCGMSGMLFLFLQAVMIPVQFRFGGQNGKIAFVAICAVAVAIVIILTKWTETQKWTDALSELSETQLVAGGLAIAVTCLVVSFLCSVKIMERKEF